MPPTSRRLKAAYLALSAADTYLSGKSSRWARLRLLTKPALMPLLAASVLTDPAAARSPLLTSTIVAEAASWGGDVALLGSGTRSFLTGTTSFGAAHLAYATGFRSLRSARPVLSTPAGRVALGLGLAGAGVLGVAAARQDKAIGLPVAGYAALISSMLAYAGNLDPAQPASAREPIRLGAAVFGLSDTVLGIQQFIASDPSPRMERTVMATYTLAQLLISEGARRAR